MIDSHTFIVTDVIKVFSLCIFYVFHRLVYTNHGIKMGVWVARLLAMPP